MLPMDLVTTPEHTVLVVLGVIAVVGIVFWLLNIFAGRFRD